MDKAIFIDLFHKMSVIDRDFARRYVTNELPDSFRYFVLLNQSCDAHPLKSGERTFPGDASLLNERLGPLTASAVVALLWRESMVPEWIDISVTDADSDHTYFTLLCCGRFAADDALMYYSKRGQGPFGLKSPNHPPRWSEEAGRFDLRSVKQ
jgi:hypothetical protein